VSGPKKSLGQHWLTDRFILAAIADAAELTEKDTVLEIGPGLGTLTSELLRRAQKVVAVELDDTLAAKLPGQFPGTSLEVIQQDILSFDLSQLPNGYVVVANVPYYITSKIVQLLMTAHNKPRTAVLLVQKEVAERMAAQPGDMSILALSAQLYADISLDKLVPSEYFTPPPKVDSQVVVLKTLNTPRIPQQDQAAFFQLVKAGFAGKRKKLRGSLAAGLHRPKQVIDEQLAARGIDSNLRAEDLSFEDWRSLIEIVQS
jgi:16S rRNA (adenine1518-N6/adenine1519-N6)-dimethyltransferase